MTIKDKRRIANLMFLKSVFIKVSVNSLLKWISLHTTAFSTQFRVYCLVLIAVTANNVQAHDNLVEMIKTIKPSVVGIGIFTPIETKAPAIVGTGFVVGNGRYIVTNYHVVSKELDTKVVQYFVALSGEGKQPEFHKMSLIGMDPVHDLAILSIENTLPALELASNELKPSGTQIAMTGFPIGAVLGVYAATHTGLVSAIAPDVNPARNVDDLTLKMLKRLKEPFLIYQLDITAFPGNSGSPIYDSHTGEVIAVLNKVFVSAGKEAALSNPSGISYAIPVMHLKKLALKHDIQL